ncbi:hypothetical protein M0G39_10045 [Klebsiella pneumoniae]|uniref:hypothetical protein n=1 Tax=Klebsiella pneumoniae TaxID=573 RepID=UPI001FF582BA|nr:hypothetical protein [Klebsiella pneumoniae]MCK1042696.1 hypothetical protein [Klebsiella pneumoniae]MCW9292614.1 hypothetical protein [Klebsiella pneumoniae]MDG5628912.1 hypothetical protein [Klebsiella pneumoniae]HBW2970359.1 hypothetical protein [Klebsiella pneumoniae]
MTSKLTRDQLRERAQLKAKNLTYAISQSAFAGVRSELEEELQFLQCALACLEEVNSEPAPVVPDDVLDALRKVARIRLDLNDFDGDRRGIADCLGDAEEALIEVVNRCAAMLAAAQQEVKGE